MRAEPSMAPTVVPRHRDHPRGRGGLVRAASGAGLIAGITASAALSAWLVGRGVDAVAGNRNALWILGRAAARRNTRFW